MSTTDQEMSIYNDSNVTVHTPYHVFPQEGATCKIIIKADVKRLPESCYPLGEEFDFEVGDSDSHVGDLLEDAVCSLRAGQSSNICVDDVAEDHTSTSEVQLPITVTLIAFKNRLPIHYVSVEDKFEIARRSKIKGVELFNKNSVKFAFKHFSKAVRYLILMLPRYRIPENIMKDYDVFKMQCYANIAACQLKSKSYYYAIENCTRALELDRDNVKCLYRRAEAYFNVHKMDECRDDVMHGLRLLPDSRLFLQILEKLHQQ